MKISSAIATLAIIGSANAFMPASQTKTSSALSMSDIPKSDDWKGYYTTLPERNEAMAQNTDQYMLASEMDKVFDPLEFTKTQSGMFFMRESEVKHGRLAMLVRTSKSRSVGWIVFIHLISRHNSPSPLCPVDRLLLAGLWLSCGTVSWPMPLMPNLLWMLPTVTPTS